MRRVALSIALALAACGGKSSAPAPAPVATQSEPKPEEPRPYAPPKTPPPEAKVSASGVASLITKPGHGDEHATLNDDVRVRFSAWNEKGKLVDSSEKRGGPVVFQLTGVIEGWRQAVPEMQLGEARRIWVPDALAYPGRPGAPRGMSVFDIELVEIIKGLPDQPAPPDVAKAPKDAKTVEPGISYKTLVKGSSEERPQSWDHVRLHYTGWSPKGTMFDSTRNHERPYALAVEDAPRGWRKLLPLLAVGERVRVWMAEYESHGVSKGPAVFELELVSIERKREPPRAPADVHAVPHDARKTGSGLAYRMLVKGTGTEKPAADARVQVHYTAWTADGALFDSSIARGKPAHVPLARLIPGWAEGLQLMSVGDKARFWIPEKLAYAGGGGPKGMLVYDVELLAIE